MDLKSIVDQFEDKEDANFKENILAVSKGIQESKTTILDLIEHLDHLLTNDHASKRELGTSILTEVLRNISFDFLNKQQLEVLAAFYSDKLNDHHQILPVALLGIFTLIQFKHFPGEKVSMLLNSILKNVPCQQQQRGDRYTVYQIFEFSLKTFKEELLAMKLEFVYMVLTSVDGERDPRNLLFLFKWMKVFLDHFSLQHLTEDIFDVLACYFPVDFRAPPNETTITREALSEALSPCLCAIPEFGDSCISLTLEKLDSSLEIAKIDSLKLLKEGCSTFPTSVYLEKSPEIWSLIQKEILTNTSDEIKQHCLTTLSAVISKISEDPSDSYLDILQNIFDTLKGNLLPDSKLFEKSSVILVYVALGSERSCKYILKEVVPILTNIYNMTAYNDQRSGIVKTLVEFTKVYLRYHKMLEFEGVPELLKVPVMCLEVLSYGKESRKIGFDCLKTLVPYLTVEIRLKLYSTLQYSIFMQDDPEVKNSLFVCLKTAAVQFPDEVKNQVFTGVSRQPSLLDSLLKSMVVLVNLKDFREYVIENYLEAIKNFEVSKIAIRNTRCLVEKEQKNNGLLKELIEKGLLHTLIELILVNNCIEMDVLNDLSRILKLLISPQTSDLQKEILEKYFEVIYDKIHQCDLNLIIMDGLVSTLRRDIDVEYKLLDICYSLSIGSQNEDVKNVADALLANLVNKKTDDEHLTEFLIKTNEKSTASVPFSSRSAIITSSWVTKGLLMRNHRHGLVWLDWLLQLLEHHKYVSEGFRIIMNDNCDSLNVDVHCNKLSLYRQKTFVYVTNKIAEKYDHSKTEYLTALGYLLEFTPLQAILLQFSKISRYIILCLEKTKEPQVLSVILMTVNTICNSDSALIEKHLEDFLDRILKLTTFESSMKVRIEALQCLVVFAKTFPLYKLLPFKSTVVHQLGVCVDDKKRFVRKEAMEARSLWFLLDALV